MSGFFYIGFAGTGIYLFLNFLKKCLIEFYNDKKSIKVKVNNLGETLQKMCEYKMFHKHECIELTCLKGLKHLEEFLCKSSCQTLLGGYLKVKKFLK